MHAIALHYQAYFKSGLVLIDSSSRLNKTKEEKHPDLAAEKEGVLKEKRKQERLEREKQKAKDREEKAEREALKWQRDHAYDEWTDEQNMRSNDAEDWNPEEDFMWLNFHPGIQQMQGRKGGFD